MCQSNPHLFTFFFFFFYFIFKFKKVVLKTLSMHWIYIINNKANLYHQGRGRSILLPFSGDWSLCTPHQLTCFSSPSCPATLMSSWVSKRLSAFLSDTVALLPRSSIRWPPPSLKEMWQFHPVSRPIRSANAWIKPNVQFLFSCHYREQTQIFLCSWHVVYRNLLIFHDQAHFHSYSHFFVLWYSGQLLVFQLDAWSAWKSVGWLASAVD